MIIYGTLLKTAFNECSFCPLTTSEINPKKESELFFMGSVKDLEVIRPVTEIGMGIGRFHYRDSTSVFDWKKNVVSIPFKGAALCLMSAVAFEKLKNQGINTHYQGLIVDDKLVSMANLQSPTDTMQISLVNVFYPAFKNGHYDYSCFRPNMSNFLIPLEFIYRNSLPEGSSVFKRLSNKTLTLKNLGLNQHVLPGHRFHTPFLDVSTKFQSEDIYLNWFQAQEMASLCDHEIKEIKAILTTVNEITNKLCGQANLSNEDGKIEFAFDSHANLMVVDSIATLDECRFMSDDIPISKEGIRRYYRQTKWYQETERSKAQAKIEGIADWQNLCQLDPEPLPQFLINLFSDLYTGTANAFIGRKIFDCPSLESSIYNYKYWLSNN
jgi:phosphoribosylaminoimidazole-succinocarboxamide synthase